VFKWLKNIFKKTPTIAYDIGVNVVSEPVQRIKIRQETAPIEEPTKKQIEKPKEIYMNENDLNNIWLVVVDTTGMDKATRSYNENNPDENSGGEVDARKLGPLGIKTFAFVNATDVNAAKGFFWRTLGAKNPAIRRYLAEIARATKVTNFSQIFPILTKPGIVWNYVGGKNEAMPGQQSNLAKQKELAGRDMYGNESAREYVHVAPQIPDGVQTQVTKNDLRDLTPDDRKVMQSNQPQAQMPAMNPNMTPQQMMQMMQMFMATMAAQAQPPVQQVSNEPSRSIHELSSDDIAAIESNRTEMAPDENDPDLQRQIQAINESGKKGFDASLLDDAIDPTELAKMAKTTQSIVPRSPEQAAATGKGKRRVPSGE
jgi:hypothetical protein